MGLLDFLSSVPIVGSVMSAVDAGLDSIGASQHGRDQYVSQENQRELLSIQNQYNQENFDRQFAAENAEFDRRYQAYQSPKALVRQYSEAGLNPSAVLAGGKAGFGGVGSAINPVSPSVPGVSPSSPMSISPKGSDSYIDAISRMKLNEAQKDEIYGLLMNKIREQDDQHKFQSILTAQKAWEYTLDKIYGKDERANKLANLIQQGLVLYMQGKESEMMSKFLEAKTLVYEDEHKMNQEKLSRLGLYLDTIIQATKSDIARNYSESGYFGAMAATEKALHQFRVTLLSNEASLSSETLQANIDKILNDSEASKYLPENALVSLEMAKKENNLYYAKQILGMITESVGTAINVRTGGRIASAMEVRNELQQKIHEFNVKNGVYEKVVDTFNRSGKQTGRVRSYSRKRPQR